MALVDYSSSENDSESDTETKKPIKPTSTTVPSKDSKAKFQKHVSSTNPRKIIVSLPQASNGTNDDNNEDEGPAAKKPRLGPAAGGGGLFKGFNSFLPAPKRTTTAASGSSVSTGGSTGAASASVKKGVGLRTGEAPAFDRSELRRPIPSNDFGDDESEENSATAVTSAREEPVIELKTTTSKFRPLSMSRKPKKKPSKPPSTGLSSAETASDTTAGPSAGDDDSKAAQPAAPKKISLFGIQPDSYSSTATTESSAPTGAYEPLIYTEGFTSESTEVYPAATDIPDPSYTQQPAPSNLDSIATDLHLTPAEKRRLFGNRHSKQSASAAALLDNSLTIKSYNLDAEYAQNQAAIASGDSNPSASANVVRSIAPGKHSLQQLVNAAASQREALEESFATGKRNRSEAGRKYGW
jgi:hypothetical protein